jgi:hypothetical protein
VLKHTVGFSKTVEFVNGNLWKPLKKGIPGSPRRPTRHSRFRTKFSPYMAGLCPYSGEKRPKNVAR